MMSENSHRDEIYKERHIRNSNIKLPSCLFVRDGVIHVYLRPELKKTPMSTKIKVRGHKIFFANSYHEITSERAVALAIDYISLIFDENGFFLNHVPRKKEEIASFTLADFVHPSILVDAVENHARKLSKKHARRLSKNDFLSNKRENGNFFSPDLWLILDVFVKRAHAAHQRAFRLMEVKHDMVDLEAKDSKRVLASDFFWRVRTRLYELCLDAPPYTFSHKCYLAGLMSKYLEGSGVRLIKLNEEHCAGFIRFLAMKTNNLNVLKTYKGHISSILNEAVRDGIIKSNPMKKVNPRKILGLPTPKQAKLS